jgi:hypothetical protein
MPNKHACSWNETSPCLNKVTHFYIKVSEHFMQYDKKFRKHCCYCDAHYEDLTNWIYYNCNRKPAHLIEITEEEFEIIKILES